MIKRICLFVGGLFIMSLGVAFSITSTLGTTPISSISYALALITGIDIGITTFIFNAALILWCIPAEPVSQDPRRRECSDARRSVRGFFWPAGWRSWACGRIRRGTRCCRPQSAGPAPRSSYRRA